MQRPRQQTLNEVVPPGSSLVEIDLLDEQPDGALLPLTHTGPPSAEQCAGHAEGWAHYLDRLAVALSPRQIIVSKTKRKIYHGERRVDARRSLDCSGPQLLGAETLSRCHSLFGKLLYRFRVFGKVRQPHAAQHVRRFGELDAVVANDLDAIAPRVSEVEERSRQHLNACLGECPANRVLVVHNKTEVAPTVRRLAASLLKRSPRSMKAMSLLLPRSLNSKIRS
jgi:hypothetical protein